MDVSVSCHGGCTIRCMYTHLGEVLKTKPDYVLLHMGTNDSCNNTSDVILNEFIKLGEFLEMALPDSKVILSLPTIRTDNHKANTII